MHAVLAVFLFVAVLVLIIWQPGGLSIGWPAALGGALAVLCGVVSVAEVARVVSIVWDATLTFVALILISLILDAVGFFEWSALHMVRAAGGDGRRLFVYSILLGALVSAFFANDGAALILTPLIYEQVRALRLPTPSVLAFVMAGGFVADATSVPLVVSNLVNIISADFFRLGFAAYAARMVPVDAVSLAATVAVLWLYFRRDLPVAVPADGLPEPRGAIRDPLLFRWSWVVLGLLLAGYLASQTLRWPVSAVAGGAALLLLGLALRSPAVDVRRLLREAPWKIVVFSIGMYVVVFGLRDAGLLTVLTHSLARAARAGTGGAILAAGGLAAGLSAGMNNLPAVMVIALAIQGSGTTGVLRLGMALANVIGSDLGPKMTPVGSLATLLWLHVLERRGLRIGWGYFCRVGIVLTLPVLACTLVALWASIAVHP